MRCLPRLEKYLARVDYVQHILLEGKLQKDYQEVLEQKKKSVLVLACS